MIINIKKKISQNRINIFGFKTSRKIIVFESDDWGSIRMPNKQSINVLREMGLKVDSCHYMLNDTLENQSDFENLFEILTKFKDVKEQHPKITSNTIVCNPDFKRIEQSNFENYFPELNVTTYNNYHGASDIEKLIKEGIALDIYRPQLHGREHVNISRWMRLLRENDEITRKAFQLKLFGISGHTFKIKRPSLMAVFDSDETDIEFQFDEIISDAIHKFEYLYGYKSETFIAPNYVWGEKIEHILAKHDVKFLQGASTQILPSVDGRPNRSKRNYLGKKNLFGQKYLIRNANFEPSSNRNKDWVASTLSEISTAFLWNKPAIINTHRVNFVSGINKNNSSQTLKSFTELLSQIKKRWPDVEFMTSDQLSKIL